MTTEIALDIVCCGCGKKFRSPLSDDDERELEQDHRRYWVCNGVVRDDA